MRSQHWQVNNALYAQFKSLIARTTQVCVLVYEVIEDKVVYKMIVDSVHHFSANFKTFARQLMSQLTPCSNL